METGRLGLRLDLTPPPLAPVRADESQEEVLGLIAQGASVSVFGFPGTGKTLVAELAASAALRAGMGGDRLVVLSADRHAAADLSARIVRRAAGVVLGRPAVTPTSLAMTILQARAQAVAASGLDRALEAAREYQPQMVTGAEQSAVLATLLELDAEGAGRGTDWPKSAPPEARRLPAFRDELRDLLMRAAERGLDAVDLAGLGQEHDRPQWVAAAHFYQRYLDILDLRNTADAGLKLDAAAMVAQAQHCLRDWSKPLSVHGQPVELDPARRPGWELVIVDDYQEASLALHRLVGQLASAGSQVVCLGSPDTAAQSFRGALPGQLAKSTGPPPDGWEAREAVLENCWRQSGELLAKSIAVTRRLRPAGRPRRALAPPAEPADRPPSHGEGAPGGGGPGGGGPGGAGESGRTGRVRTAVAASGAEAAAAIARRFREARLTQGLAWPDMAVLTRTAGQVAFLRSLLTSAGLPVRVPGSEVLATDHPAVAPLVAMLGWALRPDVASPALAVRLATSSAGRLDAADLRELRRALARAGRLAGAESRPDELLARLILGGAPDDWLVGAVPGRLGPAVSRLRAALAAGAEAAVRAGAGAGDVLWAIWQASGLGELWSDLAMAGGPRGVRADADLDAVLALFAAAARHDARKPGSGPAGFAAYLEAQTVPSDTIAAHAPEGDRVTISTAAAAVGREWELVALVDLEENVWPDLRLRDTLLGAGELADIVDRKGVSRAWPERSLEVLDDETRLLALALTRARREVLAVAVANADQQPSRFFDWLVDDADGSGPLGGSGQPGAATGGLEIGETADAAVGGASKWPFDLRGVVAEARSALTGPIDAPGGAGAAEVLAVLAALGVDGAEPSRWPGLLSPSGPERLYSDGQIPVLSPSRVESLSKCPLLWALNKVGGDREAGDRAGLGTLIHRLAQLYPEADRPKMEQRLDQHWPELGLPDGYSSRRLRAEARRMAGRLGAYQAEHGPSEYLEVEVELPDPAEPWPLPVKLVGRIDRLELLPDGTIRVVDFKTGKTAPTKQQVETNPQLGAYQVAVNAGLVRPSGPVKEAVLVYLSRGASQPLQLVQPPLSCDEDQDWMGALLERCAADASGERFEARPGPQCRSCAVKSCCPAWPEGKQVIA